ncbi:ABC transporter ATP-binding protein [Xylanibacillus composti]|uniref:ABC transporter ATP-binding protein n=2 Tax=Xylanibacillus composti TaxID=1572762 RepID=UPI0028F58367|nr:ABC transporter ATP-binding protein [Xylanibacillus composti]MDT9723916.1 ABC transporter ATP-binding protein [Xylanibacillus composti]
MMSTYHYIWRLICYRPWLYAANGIVWTLIHLAPLFPGLIIRDFFNQLDDGMSSSAILVFIAFIIGIASARILLVITGVFTDVLHRFSISSLIRKNLLDYILHSHQGKLHTGDSIVRFRDDAEQAENSISWTLDVIGKFLFATVSFILLFMIDARITSLVFIPLILIIIITNFANRKIEKYRMENRRAASSVASMINEIANLSQIFKMAASESRVLDRFDQKNQERRKTDIKDKVLTQLLDSIYSNTINIGTGLILILSAGSVRNGSFTVGDIALFMYYLTFVTDFTQFFGNFLAHYKQTGVSFKRMANVFATPDSHQLVHHTPLYLNEETPDISRQHSHRQHLPLRMLKVNNLTFRYSETNKGISDVSLQIRRGTFTVITGKIGSGKTTLLRVLLGHLPKQRGTILWNDQEVNQPISFFTPPISAYTPQVATLFSGTLEENILFDDRETARNINEATSLAVLEKDLELFPEKLRTIVGPNGTTLSGGQKQRASIARMFAQPAELYVMDDISSALDMVTERTLWRRIAQHKGENTYLVASHRKECLKHADWIIVLKDGKVASQGTLDNLLENCMEMKKLWTHEEKNF